MVVDNILLSRVAVGSDKNNVYATRALYLPGDYSNDLHLNLNTRLYTVVNKPTNETIFNLEFIPDSLAI